MSNFADMFIRRRKNKSGTTSVVVVDKSSGKFKELTTIGVSSSPEELDELERKAQHWIDHHTGQIVLGLLVSEDGYPLSYSIFNGSQYEGRTMIPIIDDFVQRFNLTDFVVVADSGLMSAKNVALLESAGYQYILGARIRSESPTIKDWILSLDKDVNEYWRTVSKPI